MLSGKRGVGCQGMWRPLLAVSEARPHSCTCTACSEGQALTGSDAVVHDTEAMHSDLLSSSLDILQLVLRLHTHILDLADRLVNVWDLSLLRSLHSLGSNL